jgi:putative RNA 2'-phosphotransferase
MSARLVTVSKFISKYLRHEPEALGLVLEPGGWVFVDDLLEGAAEAGFSMSRAELEQVVAESDKQRFSFDEMGEKIRANQGHSTAVDLQLPDAVPPATLYHGTPEKFVALILAEGLKKMKRHDVHLSTDIAMTMKVGARRGKPVLLVIDSGRMAADGYTFRVSANGVWLTDHVPAKYLRKEA